MGNHGQNLSPTPLSGRLPSGQRSFRFPAVKVAQASTPAVGWQRHPRLASTLVLSSLPGSCSKLLFLCVPSPFDSSNSSRFRGSDQSYAGARLLSRAIRCKRGSLGAYHPCALAWPGSASPAASTGSNAQNGAGCGRWYISSPGSAALTESLATECATLLQAGQMDVAVMPTVGCRNALSHEVVLRRIGAHGH